MRKKLILVAAPAACGKTYASKLLAKALEHVVYLDKDDLSYLLRAAFAASGQEVNMDGDFYGQNLRPAEYATILNIAFSALQFEDLVILNAPFVKEVRDEAYMQALADRAHECGAELVLIWVTAPAEVCYARMKNRNSDRDILKLQNWEAFAQANNYEPPYPLADSNIVDALLVFDSRDDASTQLSLENALKKIREE